jgi:hypothetical protein
MDDRAPSYGAVGGEVRAAVVPPAHPSTPLARDPPARDHFGMRTTSGAIATRLAVGGGVVAGALAGTRHVTGRPLDALTSAACVAHLPGTAARCETDRFVAHTGPFIGPAVVGGLAGLVLALVVVALVGVAFRALDATRRHATVPAGGPAWTLAPVAPAGDRRCAICGRALAVGTVRYAGAVCGSCAASDQVP